MNDQAATGHTTHDEARDIAALIQRLMTASSSTREDYLQALGYMDEAVCEARAVGQAQAARMAPPCVGYATYLFARMCSHGTAAIRAAPLTRWVKSDHQDWGFNVLACHARALLEGSLYFHYMMAPTNEELEEERARITLLQLNDCCSRLKMFKTDSTQAQQFEKQRDELQDRLRSIAFFQQLAGPVQSQCLAGKKAWFMDREQLVNMVGMDKAGFDIMWDLFSQHSHIHPMSFYRMEPNGRGSGLECDPDRLYLTVAMLMSAGVLEGATDKIVETFPDVAGERKGVQSKFSPGPKSNRQR